MTVNIAFAGSADGNLFSHSISYQNARTGAELVELAAGGDTGTYGQAYGFGAGSEYVVDEVFLSFAYSIPSHERALSAYIQVVVANAAGTSNRRDLYISPYDWGATLEVADFRSMDPSYTRYAVMADVQNGVAGQTMRGGSATLVAALTGSGTLRVFGYVDTAYFADAPSGEERAAIYLSESSGTTSDPRLVYLTAPNSTLLGPLGASVQLSDGSTAYLEGVDLLASPYARLRHSTTGGTVTTIATGTDSSTVSIQNAVGMQSHALVRSSADHLFLIKAEGGGIRAEAYTKGSGHTWTRQAALTASLATYDSDAGINNLAAAWHPVGGTAGTVMVFAMHQAGEGHGNFQVHAMLNCDSLLAGSGSLLRGSGVTDVTLQVPTSSDATSYQNETSTGLDAAAAPGTTDYGFVATYNRNSQLSLSRYRLNGTGSGLSTGAPTQDTATTATKDANSKLRVVPINSTTFATVAGDRITIQSNSSGSTMTAVASASLSTQGLATFPSASTLRGTAAWDVVYDASAQKLWFYYLSTANGRRLMRTGFSVVTGLPTGEEQEVNASVGATGSTNVAIRAPRGALAGYSVRLTVANRSAAGNHFNVAVTDSLNAPPTAPTLTPKANFSATGSALFEWTFNDPNPGDTQSAYDFQIDNSSTGASAVNTGWVTSTTSNRTLAASALTNPGSWRWRVRTKDAAGEIGPWSDYGTFSTAAGGNVTITVPATDNPAGVITDNYTVSWSVTGTTQSAYRVKLIRTDTSATLSDTGWVTSSATSYEVAGMITDVEHRVEVTVRNASLVESGTGTRLITPSFGSPEQPIAVALPVPAEGYTLVTVNNPPPSGDRPNVATNSILRRVAGTEDAYLTIGSTGEDGTFRDYTAAGGVTYEYVARGHAEEA